MSRTHPSERPTGEPYLDRRDDSPNWYIYHSYNRATGQYQRTSTRTADYKRADQIFTKWKLEQASPANLSDATVLWCMLRYWEHHGKDAFSEDTIRTVIKRVTEHIPQTRVYDWPKAKQREFLKKLAPSDGTRRRYWGVIRAAIGWCKENEDIPTLPELITVNCKDGPGVRPFEIEELRSLAEACTHERERRFFLLCLHGPRPGSTLDLTWDRVNAKTGVVDFDVPGRVQTKKWRPKVRLCAPAAAYLNDQRSIGLVVHYGGEQMVGFKEMFRRIARNAKVEGSAYGIRKATATWLRSEGVPEVDIKGVLAHSLGGETDRYAHQRPEFMQRAAASLERLLRAVNPSWMKDYLQTGPANEDFFRMPAANDGVM